MTHTLNRIGLSEANPGEEIIVLCMLHRTEKTRKAEEMQKISRTVLKYKPSNVLGAPLGFGEAEIAAMGTRAGIITAVFTDPDTVLKLVADIKAQKLGISVVLSGLFTDVDEICRETGLTPHTHNISLGVYGKTEKLPDAPTLQITTQCGHALISPALVAHVVKKIEKGKMTTAEAAQMLIKPCVCGIGNPERIEKILSEMVA